MKIWLTRHGQTNLNKKHLMQGRTDEPLNDVGRLQAKKVKEAIDVKFDKVYASPLCRAIETACIISGYNKEDIIVDDRLIEVNFGKYELNKYYLMGPWMTLYWLFPIHIKTPKTVENLSSMINRSQSFLKEIENGDEENVLVVCHGGIIRALRGYLSDSKSGVLWRPKPHNCEVWVFDCNKGKHKLDNIINIK